MIINTNAAALAIIIIKLTFPTKKQSKNKGVCCSIISFLTETRMHETKLELIFMNNDVEHSLLYLLHRLTEIG